MSIRASLVKWKVRLSYASTFATPIGIGLVAAQTVQDKLLLLGIDATYLTILVILIILMFIFAWALDHFGFFTEEINFSTERSTLLKEMINGGKK
jgi:hypothetical protein